jgi:hypothetical protein
MRGYSKKQELRLNVLSSTRWKLKELGVAMHRSSDQVLDWMVGEVYAKWKREDDQDRPAVLMDPGVLEAPAAEPIQTEA